MKKNIFRLFASFVWGLSIVGSAHAATDPATFAYKTSLKDEKRLAAGKAAYGTYCVACHGAQLQGGIGPNLVDDYWLKGCSYKELVNMIANGSPGTAMMPQKANLKDADTLVNVVLWVVKNQGTKPAGAKAPQGVHCVLHG